MLLLASLVAACGGVTSERNPVAPTVTRSREAPSTAALPALSLATGGIGPDVVEFPPRDEAFRFRLALEDEYRDRLQRPLITTFVDMEGTVVWTQEYLRYRVNGCSHSDAMLRVADQVDGIRAAPVCAPVTTLNFPPRNEPYDFMVFLESHYQTFLRRSAVTTHVDVVGNVVWTQEYLRYRATGCTHSQAQAKVFDQIAGRAVPPDCQAGTGVTGTWDGIYTRGGGFVLVLEHNGASISGRYTGNTQSISDFPVGVTVNGATYTFDLYFGDTGIQLVAEWNGHDTMGGSTHGGHGLGSFTMRRRR